MRMKLASRENNLDTNTDKREGKNWRSICPPARLASTSNVLSLLTTKSQVPVDSSSHQNISSGCPEQGFIQ